MRIFHIVAILFLIAGVYSCGDSKKEVRFSLFAKTAELKGERIGPVDYFKNPIDISIKDTLLIIVDEAKENGCLTFLNKDSYLVSHTFGRKGKGPGEIIFPDLSQKRIDEDLLLTVKDKYYSSFYNLDSIITNKNYIPENKIIYSTNLLIPYNVMQINDTLICGQVSSGVCSLFTYNLKTNQYKFLPSYIQFEGYKGVNKTDVGQILYSYTDYNVENKMLVRATRLIDQIDLIDLKNLQVKKSFINQEYKRHPYTYNGQIMTDQTMIYYLDIQANDDYIFGLYCGKDLLNATPNVGNEIHIFNWNGDAVLKIILDIGLSNILVTDKYLFGLDPFADQPLVKYNLDLLL